jgi:Caspase domain
MKRIYLIILACIVAEATVGQMLESKSPTLHFDIPNANDPSIKFFWINPIEPFSVVEAKTLVVKIGFQSPSPVKRISMFLNEKPVTDSRGEAAKMDELRGIKFDEASAFNITLARGTNTIRIEVENEKGGKRSETRAIRSSDTQLPFDLERYDHALLFATNDYTEWSDLVNPIDDAKAIAKELEENYGFKVELVLNPTSNDIVSKIREYSTKKYLDYDQLFVFFAGHGQFDAVFTDGYLVTRNSKKDDLSKESYISFSSLRTYLSNIPVNHLFLSMDVCYGGTFDQAIARGSDRGADDMYGEVKTTEFLGRKLQFKTRKYLTSGGKEYVPDGRPGEHSPFARKMLEALRTYGGRDKILTLSEVVSIVEKITPEPRYGEFPGNEPGSDFLFLAK